jgi:ATP-dependent DNA helicase RecG
MRALTTQALAELADGALRDWVSPEVLATLKLPGLVSALRVRPPAAARCQSRSTQRGTHPAQRRLAFEELLAHQLSLRLLRRASDSIAPGRCRARATSSSAAKARCRFA